jgi:hypothetical protein
MSESMKPPPIIVGVSGIEPRKQDIAPAAAIPWGRICGLPAFEMFVAERSGRPPANVADAMRPFMAEQIAKLGEQGLFDAYGLWHKEKGMWPGETPLGDLVDA